MPDIPVKEAIIWISS